jgi:hypothetical protein
VSVEADNDVSKSLGTAFWLEDSPEKRAEAGIAAIDRMENAQQYRRANDLMHASLYGNVEVFGFSPKTYGARTPRAHARLSLNVVRNVTCTVVSKIAAKNKVAPKFLTDGGDASLQRKAQGMEKAATGILYANRFYKLQRKVFRDVAVIGTGFVRPWTDERRRKVTIERVAPWNILVDDEESEEGDPKTLFYRRWYDRRVLAKMFPGKDEIIAGAGKRLPKGDTAFNGESESTGDIIAVYEGFRRPSVFGGDDGMRCIFVDSGELASAEWKLRLPPVLPPRVGRGARRLLGRGHRVRARRHSGRDQRHSPRVRARAPPREGRLVRPDGREGADQAHQRRPRENHQVRGWRSAHVHPTGRDPRGDVPVPLGSLLARLRHLRRAAAHGERPEARGPEQRRSAARLPRRVERALPRRRHEHRGLDAERRRAVDGSRRASSRRTKRRRLQGPRSRRRSAAR